jgi:hypothetical protein
MTASRIWVIAERRRDPTCHRSSRRHQRLECSEGCRSLSRVGGKYRPSSAVPDGQPNLRERFVPDKPTLMRCSTSRFNFSVNIHQTWCVRICYCALRDIPGKGNGPCHPSSGWKVVGTKAPNVDRKPNHSEVEPCITSTVGIGSFKSPQRYCYLQRPRLCE